MVMIVNKYLSYLAFLLISLAAGGIGSLFTMAGLPAYEQLNRPPLKPPSILFPIVWTILFLLMGVGAARVWKRPGRDRAILVYGVQLFFNVLWSAWFFLLQWRLFAFFWLLALILLVALMIRSFIRIDVLAGAIQIPYLLWCAFAAYLNFGFWFLNR